jgi:hypothetical protein
VDLSKRYPGGRSRDRDVIWRPQNKKPIEVIAGELLEHETLTYGDVIRILKDMCPDLIAGKNFDGQTDDPQKPEK